MGLPRSNIRQLIGFALLAGSGLAALSVGLVRLTAGLPPLGQLADLLVALLVALLLGLTLIVTIRLTLRHAARELHRTALALTETSLPPPQVQAGQALESMHATLSAAIAAVPRSDRLADLATQLGGTDDVATALALASEHLRQHLPLQGAALLVVDAERSALMTTAIWGETQLAPGLSLDLDHTSLGRALLERREVHYSALYVRELLPMANNTAAFSLFGVPLLAGERLFGMLCMFAPSHAVHLSEAQRSFARATAKLLTLAVQNGVQRQRLTREQDRLAAFEELGGLLASSQRIERALEHVLRVAARVTDSAHGSLLLLEPDERSVRFRVTLREGDLLPLNLSVAPILKHGLAGWALRERRADLIADTERDRRWLPMPGLDQMRSALVVPLLYGERVFGVLTLADPQPHHYGQRSLALASALASYAVSILARTQYDDLIAPGHATQARLLFEDRIAPTSLVALLGDDVALARSLSPQQREVVALAVGLRGLERLRDQLSAVQIRDQVLTPYYTALATVAAEHRAYLTWRDDGGLWLIFGFPEMSGDMLGQALRAAQAVQVTAKRLRVRWRTNLRHELSLSAGGAAGPVLVAIVGSGPASSLTLTGAPLREAARIQRLARTDEVLVDASLIGPGTRPDNYTLEALSPLEGSASGVQRSIFRLVSGAV